ncbi:MAG: hypothetical protein AB1489_23995 [Acidobacteriota bacterium]
MLGNAKPYFTLIAQSPDRHEVEQAAAAYEQTHPGSKVIIDNWKDHLQHTDSKVAGIWRARVRVGKPRSLLQRFFDTLRR